MQRDIAVATTIVLIGRDLKAKLVHDLHTITEREGRTRRSLILLLCPREKQKKRTENIDIRTDIGAGCISYFFCDGNTRTRSLVAFMTCICYCSGMLKVQKRPTARRRERMQTARGPMVTNNCTCVSSHLVSLQLETGGSLRSVIVA